jgi:hypothetical protein
MKTTQERNIMKSFKNFTRPFGKDHDSEAGMGITEVIIALGIVASTLTATIIKVDDASDQTNRQQSLIALAEAGTAISSSAVSLPTLMISANEMGSSGQALKNCLQSTGVCNTATRPLTLSSISGPIAGQNTSQTTDDNVFISYEGQRLVVENGSMTYGLEKNKKAVKANNRRLAYAVTATYTPKCGNGTTCSIAQSILVNVKVEPLQGNSFWESEGIKRPKPITFNREVAVSVFELIQSRLGSAQACGPDTALMAALSARQAQLNGLENGRDNWSGTIYNQYLRGVTWSGEIVCENTGFTIQQPRVGPEGPTGQKGQDRTGGRGSTGPQGPAGC